VSVGPFGPRELELGVGGNDGLVIVSTCSGNGVCTRKVGELEEDGLSAGELPGNTGGENGRWGGGSSAIRRSILDILICCSTTVSFNSPRCAYPYAMCQ